MADSANHHHASNVDQLTNQLSQATKAVEKLQKHAPGGGENLHWSPQSASYYISMMQSHRQMIEGCSQQITEIPECTNVGLLASAQSMAQQFHDARVKVHHLINCYHEYFCTLEEYVTNAFGKIVATDREGSLAGPGIPAGPDTLKGLLSGGSHSEESLPGPGIPAKPETMTDLLSGGLG
jgi:hypothetical protein